MPKRTRKEYQFPGERTSTFIVQWLNGRSGESFAKWRDRMLRQHGVVLEGTENQDTAARLKVGKLVTDLHELRNLGRLLLESHSAAASGQLLSRIAELAGQADRYLRRVHFGDTVIANLAMKDGVVVAMSPIDRGDVRPYRWGAVASGALAQEAHALRLVRQLEEDKFLLDRVRQCQFCQQWFFARKTNQKCGKSIETSTCRKRYNRLAAKAAW